MKRTTPSSVPSFAVLSAAGMLAAAFGAAALPAQPVPDQAARGSFSVSFAELDRDNDGLITRDELPADHELARRFAEFDLDGDQAISRSEFERYLQGDAAEGGASEPEEDDQPGPGPGLRAGFE